MSEIKIKIIEVKELSTKDGNKFNSYKTLNKKGKKMDVRFTRDCSIKPKEPCFVICNEDDCNVDVSRQYPCLWIREALRTEPIIKKSNVHDFLGSDDQEETEEHPFD